MTSNAMPLDANNHQTAGVAIGASLLARHNQNAQKMVRAMPMSMPMSAKPGACFMSPAPSYRSVDTQNTQIVASRQVPHGFASPIALPFASPSNQSQVSQLSTASKKVRVLSSAARRANPALVCESDYLRALLGGPPDITKRFHLGGSGERIAWKRVVRALALLTGHSFRNVASTRSRWNRIEEKTIADGEATRLVGHILHYFDNPRNHALNTPNTPITPITPITPYSTKTHAAALDEDLDDDSDDDFADTLKESTTAPSSSFSAPKEALFASNVEPIPIDAVSASVMVQNGTLVQGYAHPIGVVTAPPLSPQVPTFVPPTDSPTDSPTNSPTNSIIAPEAANDIEKPAEASQDKLPKQKRPRDDKAQAPKSYKKRPKMPKKAEDPAVFDWNRPECGLGLIGCPVTNRRCDYCGEDVNSTERSYHKRCKEDFCVY